MASGPTSQRQGVDRSAFSVHEQPGPKTSRRNCHPLIRDLVSARRKKSDNDSRAMEISADAISGGKGFPSSTSGNANDARDALLDGVGRGNKNWVGWGSSEAGA